MYTCSITILFQVCEIRMCEFLFNLVWYYSKHDKSCNFFIIHCWVLVTSLLVTFPILLSYTLGSLFLCLQDVADLAEQCEGAGDEEVLEESSVSRHLGKRVEAMLSSIDSTLSKLEGSSVHSKLASSSSTG